MISYNTIKKDKSSTIFRWDGADSKNGPKVDQGRSEGFELNRKAKGWFGFEKKSEGNLYGMGRGGEGEGSGSQGIMIMNNSQDEEQMKGYWLNNSEDERWVDGRYGSGYG